MRGKRTIFFATEREFLGFMKGIVAERPLHFVQDGMFEDQNVEILSEVEKFKPRERYLVASSNVHFRIIEVPQVRGGIKYITGDQRENPDTVILKTSGMAGNNCIVAGEISTLGETPASNDLYRFITKRLKKSFSRLAEAYVGKEANELYAKGVRFTQDPKWPTANDFRRE